MITLKVDGIHCEHCVKRITAALTADGIDHTVSLEEKTVTITDDAKLSQAIETLDDLGFDAVQ